MNAYFSLRTLSNAATGFLATQFGARGPTSNYVQGDTASSLALAAAWHDLAEQRCDVAIAGGVDSLLLMSAYLAYEQAGLLSPSPPARACRPFDRDRDGLVPGEGAGFVVLERADDAARRGATVLGVLEGVGLAADAGPGLEPKGSDTPLRTATTAALRGAPVDLVVAHGVGTLRDDAREARLLDAVIGPGVPVTAFKGHTGYLGAATAAVESVLALNAVADGWVPPIAKLEVPDSAASGIDLVRHTARTLPDGPRRALCLAWSWTGACSAVVVSSLRPD